VNQFTFSSTKEGARSCVRPDPSPVALSAETPPVARPGSSPARCGERVASVRAGRVRLPRHVGQGGVQRAQLVVVEGEGGHGGNPLRYQCDFGACTETGSVICRPHNKGSVRNTARSSSAGAASLCIPRAVRGAWRERLRGPSCGMPRQYGTLLFSWFRRSLMPVQEPG
jgi:hypothetical protein